VTREEFLTELAALDLPWRRFADSDHGSIRATTEEKADGETGFATDLWCPITAVCHAKTSKVYITDDAMLAAIDLDLPTEDAEDVIDAADGFYGDDEVDELRAFRAQLEAVTTKKAEVIRG